MVDLDLRLLRYFVAVAEQQHFGRAAQSLLIAQPSLSRQIARLEKDLQARLFDRSPQGVRLTSAGEVLLPRAREVLQAAERTAAAVRATAHPETLTVGYTSGVLLTPAVKALQAHRRGAEIRTVHLLWDQPRQALLQGTVDAVIARLPFEPEGLDITPLYDEQVVVILPLDHRYRGRPHVTLEDIADEPIPRHHDPLWDSFWRIDPRPDGRRAPDGPLVETLEDKLDAVAQGRAIAILPNSAAAQYVRPDLVVVPLIGVEPGHVVLATRVDDRRHLVSDFCTVARAHLRCETPE